MVTTRLKIGTLNVSGLNEKLKRRTIERQLQQYDIIFLQETHSTGTTSRSWHIDFKAQKAYWDHFKKNARGAAIIIRKDLEFQEVWAQEENKHGRLKAIIIKLEEIKLGLVSVYAPNVSCGKESEREYVSFFEELEQSLQLMRTKTDQIIVGGDLNIIQSKWDVIGDNITLHKPCIEAVQKCMEANKLVDIFRERNPKQIITTYTQFGITKKAKRRRLDYIYAPETIKDSVTEEKNITVSGTDHNLIMICVDFKSKRKRSPGLWRHNNTRNNDPAFIEGLTKMIEKMDYEEISDNRMKWEYLKYKISQYSREYSKNKVQKEREEKAMYVKQLEEATVNGVKKANISEEEFRELKNNVQKQIEKEEKAAIFRANVQYHEEGEKCTAYFFRQIKQNRKASNITELKNEEGSTLKGKDVGEEIYNFYEGLYKNQDIDSQEYNKTKQVFLEENIETQISRQQKEILESDLTLAELRKALFGNMKEGKAPGNDGLTSGLYKAIWPKIDKLFHTAVLESMSKGSLSSSQKQSIIRLIEKKGKDRKKIKNWRPISLINTDTKIIAKALANRLKLTLEDIIGKEQTGFLKNRNIGEGIRLTQYLVERYSKIRKQGHILAIDFQKAFDSCSHRYMKDVLRAYGYGEKFIKMIEVLYAGAESAILNEGISTKYFSIERSCRQGDPVSPYLFILLLEPLLSKLRQDKDIKGLRTPKREVKLSAYADDLSTYLKDKKSVEKVLQTLEDFAKISGLNVNRDKTEILSVNHHGDSKWIENLGIKQVKEIIITGIYHGEDSDSVADKNWTRIVEKTKQMLSMWKGRDLSLMGRITIVKVQGISQIQYLAANINMPEQYIKQINKLIYNFIWKGPDKIKRIIARRKVSEGGLSVPDAADIARAASIQWIGRGERWADRAWNDFLQEDLNKLGGKSALNAKGHKDIKLNHMLSFNKYCIKAWWDQVRPPELHHPELLLATNIWTDERLAKPKNDGMAKIMIQHGFCQVADFLDSKGQTIKVPKKDGRIIKGINILFWLRAINRIPKVWQKVIEEWHKFNPEEGEQLREEVVIGINIITKNKVIKADKMTQKLMKQNIVDKLRREDTNYRTDLDVKFGTTAMEWSIINKRVMSHSIASRNRSFVFRFNNGLTYNNKDFHRFGYRESDECTFCREPSQTNYHLFWECHKSNNFWGHLNLRLKKGTISEREVFLGDNEETDIPNREAKNKIIIMANSYIYQSNHRNEHLSWEGFWQAAQYQKRLEEAVADKQNKLETHLSRWEGIESLLYTNKTFSISGVQQDKENSREKRTTETTRKRTTMESKLEATRERKRRRRN